MKLTPTQREVRNWFWSAVAGHGTRMNAKARRYWMRMKKKMMIVSLCMLACVTQAVQLVWDPLYEPWVAGYLVRFSTNSPVTKTNCFVTIDCGTNTNLVIDDLRAGLRLYAVAHAYTLDRLENPPSNQLAIQTPSTNGINLITIVPQWSATVAGTNWQDVGFFRIKLGL